MKKMRINISSTYDIIKLQRKYNMAANENISQKQYLTM
jgi:hypothetical protein